MFNVTILFLDMVNIIFICKSLNLIDFPVILCACFLNGYFILEAVCLNSRDPLCEVTSYPCKLLNDFWGKKVEINHLDLQSDILMKSTFERGERDEIVHAQGYQNMKGDETLKLDSHYGRS